MILKFVIKNIILVAALALGINWLIKANIHLFSKAATPHSTQLQELSEQDGLQQRMLN